MTVARAGLRVLVVEAALTIGGGLRTAESTLPGFRHDVCSAVHPAAIASPFFRAFGLDERVEWVVPDVSYAHPLADGRAGVAYRDLERTVAALGRDGPGWRSLLEPLRRRLDGVVDFTGSQLLRIPRDPLAAFRFGVRALEQGSRLWNLRLRGEVARALLTGVAAPAAGPQPSLAPAGAGLLLAVHAHAGGWGFPAGGSQAIADAMVADIRSHGGRVETGRRVESVAELGNTRAVLLDTSPELLLKADLPPRYRRALERYRYGSGVTKVDFALSDPVPWRHPEIRRAPTVHLGGTREEIAAAERDVARGRVPDRPYVLITQPSVLDPTRAPAGRHVLWAYTHVPAGSTLDATELVTSAVERFAPGFRDTILASAHRSAAELSRYDENYVGGDIYSGALTLRQLVKRPVVSRHPWRTPLEGVYLCSSATPPGPAVQAMNGWFAARLALRERFGIDATLPIGDDRA
jgi:phytoene dehydrogenase-like protein